MAAHWVQRLFGRWKVVKALGFAASSESCIHLTYRAIGYNGHVSVNPLYPPYKTIAFGIRSVDPIRSVDRSLFSRLILQELTPFECCTLTYRKNAHPT